MDEVEVILEEVDFKVGLVVTLEEIIVEIEVKRIGDLGDSLDWDKEEWELDQNQAPGLDQILEHSTNRDRVQCFKCREYDHFANEMSKFSS